MSSGTRETIAAFSFRCAPKNLETGASIVEKLATMIPSPFPAEYLYDYLAYVETLVDVHDLEIDVLPGDGAVAFKCPILVHFLGRGVPELVTITTDRRVFRERDLIEYVHSQLFVNRSDLIILGLTCPRTQAHLGFIDPTATLHPVYDAAKFFYTAYVVPQAPHYAMVSVQEGERCLCPATMVPLERPPDAMSFTSSAERSLLFDVALKPYRTKEVPFDGAYSVTRCGARIRRDDHVHEFKISISPEAAARNGFRIFEGYSKGALDVIGVSKSLWKWAGALVDATRRTSATWKEIKERYLRRQYYGEREHNIEYWFDYDPATSTLSIRITGDHMAVMYYPPCMIDPEASIRWEFSRLLHMSNALKTRDAELDMETSVYDFRMASQPEGMRVQMKPYQLESLAYMLDAERGRTIIDTLYTRLPGRGWYIPGGFPTVSGVYDSCPMNPEVSGGFLADVMGSGKTCEVIALCLANPLGANEPRTRPTMSKATLVLCPASLLHQWKFEIEKIARGALSIFMFHGRHKTSAKLRDMTLMHDIVLMSYNTYVSCVKTVTPVLSETGETYAFTSIKWHRVIFEESHVMSETMSRFSPKATLRWAVSATPLKNIDRQLRALGVPDHICCSAARYPMWTSYVVCGLMCRHASTNSSVDLPDMEEYQVYVDFAERERKLYDEVRELALSRVKRDPRTVVVMNAIHGLRSVCSGGELSLGKIKAQHVSNEGDVDRTLVAPDDDLCPVCMDAYQEPAVTRCNHWFCKDCIETSLNMRSQCPMCRRVHVKSQLRFGVTPDSVVNEDAMALDEETVSCTSKFDAVIEVLRSIERRSPSSKTLIFASNATCVTDLRNRLLAAGIASASISGSTSISRRSNILDTFRTDKDLNVCLLTMRSASVGLNLAAANNVIFLDASLNPEMTAQAIGRVRRQGQERKVYVYHMIARGTIEHGVYLHVQNNGRRPLKDELISMM